jgi:hypothetical protein
MALIGNGSQSEFQALAFHRLVGIREVRLFDVDHNATAKLERNLAAMVELANLHVVRAASITEACRGADIVTTVTADKRNAVILTPPMIEAGMHLNAVGGDCPGKTELHADILRMPNARVVVEYEPQSRIEGEIQQMPVDFPVTEFAAVIRGQAPGRVFGQRRHDFRLGRVRARRLFCPAFPALDRCGTAGRSPPDRPGAGIAGSERPVRRHSRGTRSRTTCTAGAPHGLTCRSH